MKYNIYIITTKNMEALAFQMGLFRQYGHERKDPER